MSNLLPEQITFMEHNRPHYDTLVRAQFLTNVDYPTKEGMLNVARVFAPAYQANLWCSPCVCDLFKFAYVQYDKWRKEQYVNSAIENTVCVIKHAAFPKQDEPVKEKRKYTKRS